MKRNSFIPELSIAILKLEETGLKSVANIEKLVKIEQLYLNGNRINDFNDLDKLAELARLKALFLINNPINRKGFYRQVIIKKIPQLMVLDGREITSEELERVEQMFCSETKLIPMVPTITGIFSVLLC